MVSYISEGSVRVDFWIKFQDDGGDEIDLSVVQSILINGYDLAFQNNNIDWEVTDVVVKNERKGTLNCSR